MKYTAGLVKTVFRFMLFLLLFGLLLLFYLFSLNTTLCSGAEDLPSIMQFGDLHITESLKAAKASLKGSSGIYCITCQETGSMYIGSSNDLGYRLTTHVLNVSSAWRSQAELVLKDKF